MNTNPENLRLTTGRLYWQPSSDSAGYIDFGNVASYKEEPDVQRVSHWSCAAGRRRVDMAAVKAATVKKTFVLDEHFNETVKLICQGKQLNDVVQNVGSSVFVIALASLKVGRTYDMGKLAVTVTSAYTDGPFLIENVDYVIDRGSGMITPISNAKFLDEWDFEYSWAAVTQLSFSKLSSLLAQGTFRFLEFDALETVPLNSETFLGQVEVTGWGENNNDQFDQFTVEVIHAV